MVHSSPAFVVLLVQVDPGFCQKMIDHSFHSTAACSHEWAEIMSFPDRVNITRVIFQSSINTIKVVSQNTRNYVYLDAALFDLLTYDFGGFSFSLCERTIKWLQSIYIACYWVPIIT